MAHPDSVYIDEDGNPVTQSRPVTGAVVDAHAPVSVKDRVKQRKLEREKKARLEAKKALEEAGTALIVSSPLLQH